MTIIKSTPLDLNLPGIRFTLPKITHHYHGGYDASEGITEDGRYFTFLTNFRENVLPRYLLAIQNAQLEAHFAIGEEAFGFNEAEGVSFPVNGCLALYYDGNTEELQRYHAALAALK